MNPGTAAVAATPHNHCIAALSGNALALLKPHLCRVVLSPGTVLWESGHPHRHTYFPMSGLLSIVVPMLNGATIEVGTVGCEGAAGGLDEAAGEVTTRGVVLIGGTFAQVAGTTLPDLARQNREIDDMLRGCRDWLSIQAQQLAACNATHAAEHRLCRWLTTCQQRIGDGGISATQELISTLLGVRRTTVTLIAQKLHAQGLIDYSRGKISVRDPARLEAAACECSVSLGPMRWPKTPWPAMRAKAET